jgi:hypothetical protein
VSGEGSSAVTFPLGLLVFFSAVGTMYPAIAAARRMTKATMQHLGLPEKPILTVKAMQSPEDFDLWLLKTREYHRVKDAERSSYRKES